MDYEQETNTSDAGASSSSSIDTSSSPESGVAAEQPQERDAQAVEPPTSGTALLPPPALPQSPQKTKCNKRRRLVRTVIIVVLVLLVLCGGAAAYSYYYFEANIQKPLSTMIHPVQRAKEEPQLATPIPTDSAVSGRVWNILLLGSDNDQKFNFPDVLTQVLMVVHIDTIHDTVTMLSIPRDSWVSVPEVGGMHKIDQAFLLGTEQHNSFDNGVQLARLTVEKDYGISIDRYAWVGLSGFVKAIDTLGGVNIDVTHPIVDDTYPEDTGSSGYIYTDISEQELLGFALFGRTFPGNQIKHITLGPGSGNQDYGDETTIYDPAAGAEQDAIIPRCQNIQPVINHLFGLGNAQSCHVNG
ncbi:MAG: hypothetical protein E6J36_18890 [Chloroflexi bacterium]|nr:MAG: hypothetical protein E6J36_18890 [Chloroflexota bacterium]TMD79380.1 MAG: hypothetical protein E6I97_04930 [Chloroflexota bacterium]